MLTGSQQFHLMRNVTESLAGRMAILELQGLSLREQAGISFNQPFVPTKAYIEARKKHLVKYDSIWRTIHRGAYPALQDEDVSWKIFYRSYLSTYIDRDISDLTSLKDKGRFLNFLVSMAARTGQMLNYKNVADEVGVSIETARNWTSLLETSGLIYILKPYSASALKRAIKTPKLFFRDTGLVSYLTKWMTPEALAVGAMNSNIFETFVISEMLKSYTNVGQGYRDHVFDYRGKDKYWKKADGTMASIESEIDVMIEENGILYPIEIKMSAKPDVSMASSFDVLDAVIEKKRGMSAIICLYENILYLRDNLVALPLEFL